MSQQALFHVISIIFLLFCSAFFSATETAFSSLNRARLRTLADHGNARAERTLTLEERYDDLLSTILVGNNLVNIAMATIGTILFMDWLGDKGVSVSTAVITIIVLIFGEITPKSLAKERPEKFAMLVVDILRPLVWLLTPINRLFSLWKKMLTHLFHSEDEPSITSDELINLVEEAEQEGGMNAEESELVRSAIEFHDLDVNDILTPRVKVEGVPLHATSEEMAEVFGESGYSRLPVYDESIDHIVGVVHQKDFFDKYRRQEECTPASLMKKVAFVSESTKISDTLRLLQRTQTQMAVVADEYGGTAGIVTMEDILEELVGEIWDEHDEVEQTIRHSDENTYIISGSADIQDLFEILDIDEETEASTVNGWISEHLERLPLVGDSFPCNGWMISVKKLDGQIVDELELKRIETPESND